MIALYDDYYLISQACRITVEKPFYRIFHTQTACLFGENPDVLRYVSLFLLLLSSIIFIKSQYLNKKLEYKAILFVFFNSAFIIGFYYSSLLSMSFVTLWCSIFLYFFKKESVRTSIFIGFAAFFIRKEIFFYSLIFIVFDLFRSRFVNKIEYKKYLTKNKVIFFVTCFLSYTLLDFLAYLIFDSRNQLANFYANSGQYPEDSRLAVQVWASLIYLKNVILPHTMSFYGNFIDWYIIYLNKTYQYILWLAFSILFAFGTYSFFKVRRKFILYILTGISFFIVSVFLLSVLPRTDWYYTTRQVVPTMWLLLYFYDYLTSMKFVKKYNIIYVILFYFFLSNIFHIFYHYKDYEKFYYYETTYNSTSHPYVYEMYAGELEKANQTERAIKVLREGFNGIPQQALSISNRTYFYWIRNVYNAFILAKKNKDEEVIKNTYKILTRNRDFYSLIACLQVNSEYKNCLIEEETRQKFCRIYNNQSPRYDIPIVFTPAVIKFGEDYCK